MNIGRWSVNPMGFEGQGVGCSPGSLAPCLAISNTRSECWLRVRGFASIAVLTLAFGIGANSAIFSVIDSVLLRPLSFKYPDQLVMAWNVVERGGITRGTVSFADSYDYRSKNHGFQQMAYYGEADTVLSHASEAQAVTGVCVGGDCFETLGGPALGRGFTSEEAKAGGPNVAVISHGLWQRTFAGNPMVIGQQVTMIFRRPLSHRIEIIGREINAMTDSEQRQMLTLWLPLFRPHNLRK